MDSSLQNLIALHSFFFFFFSSSCSPCCRSKNEVVDYPTALSYSIYLSAGWTEVEVEVVDDHPRRRQSALTSSPYPNQAGAEAADYHPHCRRRQKALPLSSSTHLNSLDSFLLLSSRLLS
ncbi:hypothetical protein AAHE18_08G225300 [Arachis hypogaea]